MLSVAGIGYTPQRAPPYWAIRRRPSPSPPTPCALAEQGLALEEDWIVLACGMTDAVPLEPGRPVTARFTHLGTLTITHG